jgi:hypothetical protein
MPDGSYYIRAGKVGASDLQNAIQAVGRGQEDSHNAIRVHIMKRAKALGLSDEIPDTWNADGSLKHDALDQLADGFLQHFGITGMRWGQHLPGTEAVGGKGNPDGANGPSAKYLPAGANRKAAFIQRGDHTGDKPGSNNGPPGHDDVKTPDQQANESVDFLSRLRDHVAQQTEAARAEAEDADHAPGSGLGAFGNHSQGDQSGPDTEAPPPKSAPVSSASTAKTAKPKSSLTSQQAQAVHEASKKHLANVSQIHNKAKAAQLAHKKNKRKLATHPNKGVAKRNIHAASKQHAAQMHHLANVAKAAHKAHQEHMAKLKSKHKPVVNAKAKPGHLTTQDKAALRQLSPAQRSALKKVPANLRAHAGSLSLKQQNDLRLTPNERKALSHLSPKQKEALAKATAASAKARHERALAKKAGHKIVSNASTASARKATAAAQAHRTPAQQAAVNKLRLNAQNGTQHAVDEPEGTFLEHDEAADGLDVLADGFLEHHGIKGMKWGVRRNGGHPGREEAHPVSSDAQKAHEIAKTIHEHGTAALSNDDLQHLVNRQRLLQQHAQLNPADPSNYRRGLDFVKSLTNDVNTVVSAVNTGQRAVKTVQGLNIETPPHRQSRRTRNKPLKVVNIRAA